MSSIINKFVNPLNKFGNIGKIHSVFENSFNIRVNDNLINVASTKEYISSFGISISESDFSKVKKILEKDLLVKLEEKSLIIYGRFETKRIDLDNLNEIDLIIKEIPDKNKAKDYLLEILDELNLIDKIGLPLGEKENKIISDLIENQIFQNKSNLKETIDFLIGRGKGLTPSGDDIIVGYLFILLLYDNNKAKKIIEGLTDIKGKTTDISYEYIKLLLKNYVSLPIYNIYIALRDDKDKNFIKQKVEELTKIGHTSGKDMSFGMYLSLKNIS